MPGENHRNTRRRRPGATVAAVANAIPESSMQAVFAYLSIPIKGVCWTYPPKIVQRLDHGNASFRAGAINGR